MGTNSDTSVQERAQRALEVAEHRAALNPRNYARTIWNEAIKFAADHAAAEMDAHDGSTFGLEYSIPQDCSV